VEAIRHQVVGHNNRARRAVGAHRVTNLLRNRNWQSFAFKNQFAITVILTSSPCFSFITTPKGIWDVVVGKWLLRMSEQASFTS